VQAALFGSIPPMPQYTLLAALKADAQQGLIENKKKYLQDSRKMAQDILGQLPGVMLSEPQSGLHIAMDVSGLLLPADEVAQVLLEEVQVACLPGADFGSKGSNILRISLATEQGELRAALEKVGSCICQIAEDMSV